MRKVDGLDVLSDSRVKIVKDIIPQLINLENLRDSIVVIMPDNNVICITNFTTIFVFNLKECTPGYTILIDKRTFWFDDYKLEPDEYIAFNQSSSDIYLNIQNATQMYYYNISNYILIDKIEDITSYEIFQQEYLSLKASDGNKFFRGFNNKFIISIYNKFPNIAKSDKANLYVYDFDINSILVVWEVFKKKYNRPIYTIYRAMKLDKK